MQAAPAWLPRDLVVARPFDKPAELVLKLFRLLAREGVAGAGAQRLATAEVGAMAPRLMVLMRTLVVSVSRAANSPLTIAPPCCRRMTGCEAALMDVLCRTPDARGAARSRILLADLIGRRDVDGLLDCCDALAATMADAGMPLVETD